MVVDWGFGAQLHWMRVPILTFCQLRQQKNRVLKLRLNNLAEFQACTHAFRALPMVVEISGDKLPKASGFSVQIICDHRRKPRGSPSP